MTTKVWNLMYAVGTTGRVVGDAENPQRRASALEGAATIQKNGWRVWVDHHKTGERIFESDLEVEHQKHRLTQNATTMQTGIPTLEQIKALDGRIVAMLTRDEVEVLDFFLKQGRKFDVTVSLADPGTPNAAESMVNAKVDFKRSNCVVSVSVGAGATAAWQENCSVDGGDGQVGR